MGRIDLSNINKVINNFLILEFSHTNKHKKAVFKCKCKCENIIYTTIGNIKRQKGCNLCRFKDISGKQFNSLLVIEMSEKRNKRNAKLWKCECTCGNICYVQADHLIKGRKKSCGCLKWKDISGKEFKVFHVIECIGKRENTIVYKCICKTCNQECIRSFQNISRAKYSCGCIGKRDPGMAALNNVYISYRTGAKRRKFEFNLTKEEFKQIIDKNCYYCDEKPNIITINGRGTNGSYTHNGIDRVLNTEGYNTENCVPCCTMCNKMKLIYEEDKFLSKVKQIYEFNKLNERK